MRGTCVACIGLAGLLCAATAVADSDTLPEMAKRATSKSLSIERMGELVPVSWRSLVERSDIVVHGRIELVRSYLSDDKRDIYTEYRVIPLRVMFDPQRSAQSVPSVGQPLSLTRWGGELLIGDVHVSLRDRDAPPLTDGAEAIVFLAEDRRSGTYALVSEVTGVLPLRSGRVALVAERHAYGEGFDRIDRATVDDLEAVIQQEARPD